MSASRRDGEEVLPVYVKAGFALGDHTVNIPLATVSLFFLTEVAGLPPSQAGLVLLAGRAFDAFTDPWSMLGDVIDEDELATGERREGMYAGFFTFLRKLGGAMGVAVAGFALELSGFLRGAATQSETAILAVRLLTSVGPILFLLLAAWIALRYPLTRRRHGEIAIELARRRASPVS